MCFSYRIQQWETTHIATALNKVGLGSMSAVLTFILPKEFPDERNIFFSCRSFSVDGCSQLVIGGVQPSRDRPEFADIDRKFRHLRQQWKWRYLWNHGQQRHGQHGRRRRRWHRQRLRQHVNGRPGRYLRLDELEHHQHDRDALTGMRLCACRGCRVRGCRWRAETGPPAVIQPHRAVRAPRSARPPVQWSDDESNQPFSTGRAGSLHHSLQLPAYRAVAPRPAISMAMMLGTALTPLPQ